MRSRRDLAVLLLALVAVAAIGAVVVLGKDPPAPRPVANRAFTDLATDGDVVVWAVGDAGRDTAGARALGDRIAADDPARVLYLGDVYEHGTPEDMRTTMREGLGPLVHRILPTPGNHDWPQHLQGYDPFWRSVTRAPTPPWYAVRLGSWQVLSLNSEAAHGTGSAQVDWLDRQLARPPACLLAFWHRPRFSAGRHGDQDDVAPLWDALVGRAALVLNGHDHDLQRMKPIDGTTEVVSGAGGKSHYGVGEDRRLAFADDEADAAYRIVLHPHGADLAAVDQDGHVLDRSSVACRS